MTKVPVQIIPNPRTNSTVLFDPMSLRTVRVTDDLPASNLIRLTEVPKAFRMSDAFDKKWTDLAALLDQDDAPPMSLAGEHINELVIGNTYACNMGCTYCYNELDLKPIKGSETTTGMSIATAIAAVRETMAQVPEGDLLSVLFVGGEPLLERKVLFNAVEELRSLAEERRVRLAIAVYTNATMMTQAIIDWGSENEVSFVVSIDGPGILNAARVLKSGRPTIPIVLKNVRRLAESGTQQVMRVRSVTTPNTLLLPLARYLKDLGFNEIHIQALYSENGITSTSMREYEQLLAWWKELMLQGVVLDVQPFSAFLQKLTVRTRALGAWYPCKAGRNAMTVGPDGRIYSCHHAIEEDDYAMGHVDAGVPSIDVRRDFFKSVDERSPCQGCWAKHLCGGECYHRSTSAGLSTYETMDAVCDERRRLIAMSMDAFLDIAQNAPNSLVRLLRADLSKVEINPAAYDANDLSAYLE